MKASLTFDLKEDQHTFDCMMNSINMHSVLNDMREHLRELEKYQNLTDDQYKLVGELREWFQEQICVQGLTQLF